MNIDSNSILQAINMLAGQYANNIPIPQLPSLNFQASSGADLSAKYQEFLDKASKDPNIVNYYNNLLQQAQGDTNLAISFLEKEWQTGKRQITDNLTAALQNLGLTFGQESNTLQDTLNKRGIALTQEQGQQPVYAGGGQAQTEVGNLGESQKLRQEAEQRSASQGIENMGIARQKGITSAGQQLYQTATQLGQQKKQDIMGQAGTNFNIYQNQQYADAANKQNQRDLVASGGATPPPYKPNVQNQTVSYGGVTWKGNPGSDWSTA